MSRRLLVPALLVLLAVLLPGAAQAHVGSPNVFFDGDAGPYPVRVIIRPPEVVPGLAEITVRLESGEARDVTVQPVYWQAGLEGAPPADVAVPVPGQAGSYTAQLWLMRQGSYTVRVRIDGSSGQGTALVPVTTAPTELRTMQRGMGVVLSLLGIFLFVGALTIVGAAVRESVLAPGEVPDPRRKVRARAVAVASGLLLALILFGGKRWWDSVDAENREDLYRPFAVKTSARTEGSARVLSMEIDDARRQEWTPLIPDHGKLMHMFLVREPGLDAFAHLHPVPGDQDRFDVTLPPLPAGRYRVYGDVVHETGFPQTLVDEIDIPAAPSQGDTPGSPPPDPDDSWRASAPVARTAGPAASPLGDGFEMTWRKGPEPLAAGRELDLRFEVKGPGGHPVPLEPYMGMLSHAVITRDDGEVFVHLHPVGSFSMASQQAFEKKLAGAIPAASGPAMDHSAHRTHLTHQGAHAPSVVSFPYEFPKPGRYRIWVQVKSGGKVMTGVFDTEVQT